MTKTALLAAGALFALTGSAFAATTVSLDGECDIFTITANSKTLVAAYENVADCETFIGGGLVGKVRGVGKRAVIGGIFNGAASTAWTISFSEPLATGGTWSLYKTSDGITEGLVLSGTYTITHSAALERPGTKRVTDILH